MFCKHKDIFGEVKKGAHSYRLFNIAIVDVLATLLVAWLISWSLHYNFVFVLVCLFVIGIIMHRLFCVRTTIDKWLFGEP
jgi:hypothetical protein